MRRFCYLHHWTSVLEMGMVSWRFAASKSVLIFSSRIHCGIALYLTVIRIQISVCNFFLLELSGEFATYPFFPFKNVSAVCISYLKNLQRAMLSFIAIFTFYNARRFSAASFSQRVERELARETTQIFKTNRLWWIIVMHEECGCFPLYHQTIRTACSPHPP